MTKKKMTFGILFVFHLVAMFFALSLVNAAEEVQATAGSEPTGMGYIGAGIAVGLACIGSAYAVGRIGSAGIGAVTEKPELMGKILVFLGLAEGIAIYGLIIAIMVLNKF
jgi:V/A-type H+/Na+-transporting ATPase subunit K